ncbi:MAG TPA: 2OG-Fe dioxygenase family protein [Bdellovibrionales bacterium]|nr:2OG-Fe dioxygenase family protein [Bdellovibrionales bacterium]
MPEDPHLFKGEGERRRRYGRFLIEPASGMLKLFKHDSFFQDKKFDALYGDLHREFAPMTPDEYENGFLQMLLIESFKALPLPGGLEREPFEVSAHMIRIEAAPGNSTGRPAPEGIHRDGYHFGSIHLMRRDNVKGAVNNIYDLEKKLIDQKTLGQPMDSIYFDDAAIFHGVSPFEQDDPSKRATRDMLILLYQPLSESPQKPSGELKVLRSLV